MAFLKRINTKAKSEINTGFGSNNADYGGRFVNKDGRPNIEKRGLSFFERISWFHTMLQMSNLKFLSTILLFFISINFLFALVYYFIGVDHLGGLNASTSWEKFGEAYFFSAQTFTTVGYGRINPTGLFASAVASFEALLGLLTFAIATGLFYARFSKPRAFLQFSENAVLAPFKDGLAIMLRIAPYKNNNLTDAEAKLTAGITLEENGKMVNRFFPLELEYNQVNALTLSWTIVHPINEESPFYTFTKEDFENSKGEILVFVKAFDDMFSNTVVARSSYTLKEIVLGAKFVPMYHRSEEDDSTVLDMAKLNEHIKVDISSLLSVNS
jgi:inward rectifier potassium channel